ncbi:hypothetical protein H7J51_10790 [Mycobacterium crocinum]|uniref:Intersectin-EH binding protein Ibp1 n=2 Tax=Mycolicibacterium TaxID=1866885 RepID=A0ABX8VV02_9MYCO|nr:MULTISPECIES: hypothetical protein [Mycolicibacterium]APE18459.1 hypothetical protein BOH72_27475 [Mycobacterium sp. WY10]MCV7215769.1 hypothetical protein [Mycolicibacterium crocinum]QYL20093.1 hypothetical protein K0O64_23910 [Mycolicibacterium pallens]ULN44530.1 hypothetical protein MI149_24335 [Mycolicibacterium crocinum]
MLVAALVALPALIGAPQAVADPEDHVPYCSGDQTPMNSNCQDPPEQGYMSGSPGANPDTPLGLNPGVEPVI